MGEEISTPCIFNEKILQDAVCPRFIHLPNDTVCTIETPTAILKMQPPTSLKLLRGFIGMVNYYRDMWPHCSHILAPLTKHTGAPKKVEKQPKFNWTPEMQKAFDKMKALMTADVMCAYPNHNKPCHIYTDASNLFNAR
jgi:hypothetical protein